MHIHLTAHVKAALPAGEAQSGEQTAYSRTALVDLYAIPADLVAAVERLSIGITQPHGVGNPFHHRLAGRHPGAIEYFMQKGALYAAGLAQGVYR